MSVLRLIVLILAALIFFVGTGLSQESNGFWPLTGEFSAEGTYVGEGDVERGGKHVNDFDEIDSDIRVRSGLIPFSSEPRFSPAYTTQVWGIYFGMISTCLLSSAARTFTVLTYSLSLA